MIMFGVNCNFDILKYLYFYLYNLRCFNENVFLIYLYLNLFIKIRLCMELEYFIICKM